MISIQGPAASTEFALPLVTAELQTAFEVLYDAGRLPELIDPHSLLPGVSPDWYTPPKTPWPRPRLGQIYWPVVGLARYAFACLLVDEYTLGQLQSQISGAGAENISVILRDGAVDTLGPQTLPMFFLCARPIARTSGDPLTPTDGTQPMDAWVVILVDARYFLLQTSPAFSAGATDTWAHLFGNSGAGVTITDAVDAAYLTPGARWTSDRGLGRSLSWLLDSAAAAVGSRIVADQSGGYSLQRPTVAHAGTLAVAANVFRWTGGGPIPSQADLPSLPSDIQVVFGGPTETTPAQVTVTVPNPAPTGYDLSTWVDAPASTAGADRSTLAAQWVDDWIAWQDGLYDTTHAGFIPVPATGYCWAVEYFHSADQGYTKFVRPPVWYGYTVAPQVAQAPATPPARRGPPGLDGEDGNDGLPGPRGRPGQDGARGPRGAIILAEDGQDGDDGPRGRTGPQGVQGLTGRRGMPGLDGDDGLDGARGQRGPLGPQGIQGRKGPPGLEGEDGEDGERGPKGRIGDTGPRGPRGAVILSDDGLDGDWGPPGRKGRDGAGGFGDVIGPDCALTGQLAQFSDPSGRFISYTPNLFYTEVPLSGIQLTNLILRGPNTLTGGSTFDPTAVNQLNPPGNGEFFGTVITGAASVSATTYPGGYPTAMTARVFAGSRAGRPGVVDGNQDINYYDAHGALWFTSKSYTMADNNAAGRTEIYPDNYGVTADVREVTISNLHRWMAHYSSNGTPGITGSCTVTVSGLPKTLTFTDGIITGLA